MEARLTAGSRLDTGLTTRPDRVMIRDTLVSGGPSVTVPGPTPRPSKAEAIQEDGGVGLTVGAGFGRVRRPVGPDAKGPRSMIDRGSAEWGRPDTDRFTYLHTPDRDPTAEKRLSNPVK